MIGVLILKSAAPHQSQALSSKFKEVRGVLTSKLSAPHPSWDLSSQSKNSYRGCKTCEMWVEPQRRRHDSMRDFPKPSNVKTRIIANSVAKIFLAI